MDDRDIVTRLRDPNADDCSVEAAEYVERLEAFVRAFDDAMRYATVEEIQAVLDVNRGRVWGNLVAARSRVNLPAVPDSSGNPSTGTSQSQPEGVDTSMIVEDGFGDNFVKCGKDCSGHFSRPGEFQCNHDGAKCPNKEASDEH